MRKLFFAFILCCLSVSIFAQKVGHINTGILLEELPEVKSADAALNEFQKPLLAKGEGMLKTHKENYAKFQADINAQILSPKEQQEHYLALEKGQNELRKYQQEVQDKILKKREELLGPILQRVEKAIQDVGKEGSFLFIFDTSIPQTMLFAEEQLDIMPLVKSKLGI